MKAMDFTRRLDYKNPIWWLKCLVGLGFLLVVGMCLYKSLCLNFVHRSFWLDEAALAESFSMRSLGDLTSAKLQNNQIAPVLWLYVEKIVAIVFGNTEQTLRAVSWVGFASTLVFVYLAAKYIFEVKLPLAPTAFVGTVQILIRYSNVFKPYIWDGALILVVFLSFYLFKKGKIKRITMSIVWMVLLWASNPVCFFEGGILISEGFFLLAKIWKNRKDKESLKASIRGELKDVLLTFVLIVASFAIYYFYWLRDVAEFSGMQDYWDKQAFPLFPTSKADFEKGCRLLENVYGCLCVNGEMGSAIFSCLIFFFVVKAFVRRRVCDLAVVFGFLLALFASYVHMSPIESRLCLFWCVLLPLMAFSALDWLLSLAYKVTAKGWAQDKERYLQGFFLLVCAAICVVLVQSNDGLKHYEDASRSAYWKGEELYPQVEYIENNLKDDEKVCVFDGAKGTVKYIFRYDQERINEWGNNPEFSSAHFGNGKDLDSIASAEKYYILMMHFNPRKIKPRMQSIQNRGFLNLVSFEHETPLWYFCQKESDSPLMVKLSVESSAVRGDGFIRSIVKIDNVGKAYLNHDFETVMLCSEDGVCYDLKKNIAPGESQKITVTYPVGKEVGLGVVQNGKRILAKTTASFPSERDEKTARFDVKLNGKNAAFDLIEKSDETAKVLVPSWMQKGGKGYQIESDKGRVKSVFQIKTGGRLDVVLRGVDIREPSDNTKFIPVWIDYMSFKINGVEMLNGRTAVWHNEYRQFHLDVKAGEKVTLEAGWEPHRVLCNHE